MDLRPSGTVDLDARVRADEAVSLRAQKFPAEDLRLLVEEVLFRLASRFEPEPSVAKTEPPSDREISALADKLISSDADEALNEVLALSAKGVCNDTIYLGYIAGAARLLGERWEADTLSFAKVTLGAGRLYVLLRALRPAFVSEELFDPDAVKTALFGSTPGEDHVIGVTMAADIFREHGWTINLKVGVSHDQFVQAASEHPYPVIGLSASSRRMLLPLTRLIASLRVVNPASYIVVSGELATLEDDLAKIVDADFIAHDALEAMKEMQRVTATTKSA